MDTLQLPDPQLDARVFVAAGPPSRTEARWPDVLAQVSSDIAGPLTAALERVQALTDTGRIDRQGLRQLREELNQARQVAMTGQRLARYACGQVKPSAERVDLSQMLRELIQQRAGEWRSRGLLLRPMFEAAEVHADPSLLFGLLNTLLDWAAPHARSAVDLRLRRRGGPARVHLLCRFSHRPPDEVDSAPSAAARVPALDTLAWWLLQQLAATMELDLVRRDTASECTLTLDFASPGPGVLDDLMPLELDPHASRPGTADAGLRGSAVLVVAQSDLAQLVKEAVGHLGLSLDFLRSIDEASEFCRRGLPRAIVCEASLGRGGLARLRQEMAAAPGQVAVIEIEAGDAFEVSDYSGTGSARVGREALLSGLPAALAFELSRGL